MAKGSYALVLTIESKQDQKMELEDVGLFLYDLATLYDLIRLAADPAYSTYRFGKYPLFRGRRPLKPGDQLIVDRIDLRRQIRVSESVETAGTRAQKVIELYACEIGLLFDVPLAEVKRKKLDAERARIPERGAEGHIRAVLRRLRRSPLKVGSIEVSKR